MKAKRSHKDRAKQSLTWLTLFCLSAAIATSLIPRISTIEVATTTELLEFDTTEAHFFSWDIAAAEVRCDPSLNSAIFSGRVEISPDVRIRIERISNGPLDVELTAHGPDASVGRLHPESGTSTKLGKRLCIIVKNFQERSQLGQSVVLPISGVVTIGGSAEMRTSASSPIMRQGQISVIGTTLLGNDLYKSEVQQLVLGDSVEFREAEGPAIGLISIDERPAMTATIRAKAKEATVRRLPASGYSVGLTLLDRLQKDDSIQAIWVCFIFLLGLRKLGD